MVFARNVDDITAWTTEIDSLLASEDFGKVGYLQITVEDSIRVPHKENESENESVLVVFFREKGFCPRISLHSLM